MSSEASGFLSRKRVAYVTLALVVAVVAAFAFYSIYHTSSSGGTVARTVKVTKGTVQASVSASGNLSTVKTAQENFVSGGTLATLNAKVGEKVKAGQVLATIDSTSQNSALQQAATTLNVAKMNDANALTSYRNDERTLTRDKSTLATTEAGGTTVQQDQNQETLINAEQQLTNDQNQLTTAETQEANDGTTLSTATATYTADENLGCPASSTSSGCLLGDRDGVRELSTVSGYQLRHVGVNDVGRSQRHRESQRRDHHVLLRVRHNRRLRFGHGLRDA
jgi:multidrug efflux pump subunit AcrA (membrane-fusion protein)